MTRHIHQGARCHPSEPGRWAPRMPQPEEGVRGEAQGRRNRGLPVAARRPSIHTEIAWPRARRERKHPRPGEKQARGQDDLARPSRRLARPEGHAGDHPRHRARDGAGGQRERAVARRLSEGVGSTVGQAGEPMAPVLRGQAARAHAYRGLSGPPRAIAGGGRTRRNKPEGQRLVRTNPYLATHPRPSVPRPPKQSHAETTP